MYLNCNLFGVDIFLKYYNLKFEKKHKINKEYRIYPKNIDT